jgi:hypothetical protein
MSIKDLAIQAHEAQVEADAAAYKAQQAADRARTIAAARSWFMENIATPDSVDIVRERLGDHVVVVLDGMKFHWGKESYWHSYGDRGVCCCVLVDERLPPNFTCQEPAERYSRPIHNLVELGKVLKGLG